MRLIDRICKRFSLKASPNGRIRYIEGDATRPYGCGFKLIIHCCNDKGAWGAGFVLALSKLDPNAENMYRLWRQGITTGATGPFELGQVQFAAFHNPLLTVANMIGQHGTGVDADGNPPIRYEAIRKCLRKVRKYCHDTGASVHAPRFGSDLAGGDWNIIEKIIEEELTTWGISVTVYDWKG